MKKLFIFALLFTSLSICAQIDSAFQRVPIVTGSNSGDGDLKAAFILLNAATTYLYLATENNSDSLAARLLRLNMLQTEIDSIFFGRVFLNPQSDPPDDPREGMVYFDTDTKKFFGYNGTEWIEFPIDEDEQKIL